MLSRYNAFYKGFKVKRKIRLPFPAARALRKMGMEINEARRRRVTIALMAERADVSQATIAKIEKGDPTTSIGAYSSVLFVLGMVERLLAYDINPTPLEIKAHVLTMAINF